MSDKRCATRYPIVLIHGAGFRDLKWPVYWGRIPRALEERGASVFYGLQDCWGSVETNAEAIAARNGPLAREMMRAHLQKDYAPYLKDIENGGQD